LSGSFFIEKEKSDRDVETDSFFQGFDLHSGHQRSC
jgi:hypothetical protein